MSRWKSIWAQLDIKGGPLMGAFTVLVLGGGLVAIVLRLSGILPNADLPPGLVSCYQYAIPTWGAYRIASPMLHRWSGVP